MTRSNALFALLLFVIAAAIGFKHFSKPDIPLKHLKGDALILAFGDSLTYGTGAPPNDSYPSRLEQRIHRKVINAGIPGELSGGGVKRLSSVLDAYHPDILLLCHGGNDILQKNSDSSLRSNLEIMIRLARTRNIDVFLIAVPQFALLHLSPHPMYEEVAETYHLPVEADILSDLLSDNRYKSDYLHPNDAGYEKMAEAVEKMLRKKYRF